MNSAEQYAQPMPPSPVVAEAAQYLAPGSKIIDLGAGAGNNSFYLAALGHNVRAIEVNDTLVEAAQNTAAQLGYVATKLTITQGDIIELNLQEQFDGVICTAVLPLLGDRQTVHRVLEHVTNLTTDNGLNALSVLLGKESGERKVNGKNRYLFAPGELACFYRLKGWQFQSRISHVDPQYVVDKGVMAVESFLAFNTTRKQQIERFIQLSEYYRHDPELSDYYLEQASVYKT